MIKCKDYGVFTCIGGSGKPKRAWNTQNEAIENAKYMNAKYPKEGAKLVAYKCTHCGSYHLTTVLKKYKIKN